MKKVVLGVGICICLVSFVGCKAGNKAKPESSSVKVSESYLKDEKKEKVRSLKKVQKLKMTILLYHLQRKQVRVTVRKQGLFGILTKQVNFKTL